MTTHAISESYLGRGPTPRRTVDIGGFVWTVTKLLDGQAVEWRARNHSVDFVVEVKRGRVVGTFVAPVRCEDRSTPVDLMVGWVDMEASTENVDLALLTGASMGRGTVERLIDVKWAKIGAELRAYHEGMD